MTIYVSHSRKFDYQTDLYLPLRNSFLNSKHKIILPHEESEEPFDSKFLLQSKKFSSLQSDKLVLFESGKCDLVLAEVSYPSTGQGIELGWADANNVNIICVYKKGSEVSNSLKVICKEFFEYENPTDMKLRLEEMLKDYE